MVSAEYSGAPHGAVVLSTVGRHMVQWLMLSTVGRRMVQWLVLSTVGCCMVQWLACLLS